MAHPQQKEFIENVVKSKFPEFFENKKVLEIGSYNINGTMRDFFTNCDYTGVDVAEGAGVDVVCKGHEFFTQIESFDVCLSCECFEHDPFWERSFWNMVKHLKPGGLLFFTCATTGRPEHGTANIRPEDSLASTANIPEMKDYYKNLTKIDFAEAFPLNDWFEEYVFLTNDFSCDLYFYAIKK